MFIEKIKNLKNNEGITLKDYKEVTYKSGYQVATEGLETTSLLEVFDIIKAYNGCCGVWLSDGVYYVDKSKRIATKQEAVEVGKECKQLSILKWSTMDLIWL